ncbi:MAG: hypothetical protein WDN04_01295 [Rhodospirillales bacterium]
MKSIACAWLTEQAKLKAIARTGVIDNRNDLIAHISSGRTAGTRAAARYGNQATAKRTGSTVTN